MKNLVWRQEFGWMLIAVAVAACLALFISVSAGYYALLFAAVAWWTWIYPEEALLFFIMLAPLLPMFKLTQTVENFTLVKDVFIATLFVRQFLRPLLKQTLPYRRNVFLLPILVLIAWLGVAALRADSHVLGILRLRDLGMYLLLYVGVLYLPLTKEILLTRVKWLLSGLVVVLVLAIYQWLWAPDGAVLRFDPARQIWIPRISATFGHPTVFGEYLIMIIAGLSAGWLVLKENKWRWLTTIGILLLLPFIYLTYSRGVWLGLICAWGGIAIALIWQRFHLGTLSHKIWKQITGGLVLLILLLAASIYFTPVGTFVRSAFDPTYPSNQIRLQFLNRLIAATSNTDALIGKGLGDVVQQTSLQVTDVTAGDILSGNGRAVQLSQDSTLVDDQYLKTFIEMGLVGLLIYGWIYGRFWKYSYQLLKQAGQMEKIIGIMGIGFLVAFVVQALFVDIWDVFPTEAYFWIMAAVVSATCHSGLDPESSFFNTGS
jgi:hypothetical protein